MSIRAAIFAPVFDVGGYMNFSIVADQESFKVLGAKRFGSVTNCLDETTELYDSGANRGSTKFSISSKDNTKEVMDFFTHMVTTYSEVMVSTIGGLFLCWPESCQYKKTGPQITLVIIEER